GAGAPLQPDAAAQVSPPVDADRLAQPQRRPVVGHGAGEPQVRRDGVEGAVSEAAVALHQIFGPREGLELAEGVLVEREARFFDEEAGDVALAVLDLAAGLTGGRPRGPETDRRRPQQEQRHRSQELGADRPTHERIRSFLPDVSAVTCYASCRRDGANTTEG